MDIIVFAYVLATKKGILKMNTIKLKKYSNGKNIFINLCF
jgi:hypothetical protein